MENWKDIPGYEGRYQVSDLGRVKSAPFMQRYLLRNGKEAYRRTSERILAEQVTNSGYRLVHLHLNGARSAKTVHSLVASAFVPNPGCMPEVNHKDGNKINCAATNLEWVTSRGNKLHAVEAGLIRARRVTAPNGKTYPSIAQAAKVERVAHRTAAKWVTA